MEAMKLEFVCQVHDKHLLGTPTFMNDTFLKEDGDKDKWWVDTSDMHCPKEDPATLACVETWDIRRK